MGQKEPTSFTHPMKITGIDANKVDTLMTSQAATYNAAMQADAAEGNAMARCR